MSKALKTEIIIFLILAISYCPYFAQAQISELDQNKNADITKKESPQEPVNGAVTNNQPSLATPQSTQQASPASTINVDKNTNNISDPKQNLQIKYQDDQLNLSNKRLLISNFAKNGRTAVVEANYNISAKPDYHQVKMRLTGSMCLACLKTLKEKLEKVFGIDSVTISNPQQSVYQLYSPDFSRWVEATIVYDKARLALPDLKAFLKNQGYLAYKIVDK